jgi:hypothetical protein
MLKRIWPFGLVFLLALAPAAVMAAPETPKPLFASADVIHLTIQGPLTSLAQTSERKVPPAPGTLSVNGATPETLPITLEVRGITRRKHETCQFPPFRIAFTQKPTETSLFRGQKKLKLVTHCRTGASFEQYMLTEYSAYLMYNIITPVSYKVRLAQIDYVDASGKPLVTRMGFLIEDTSDLGKRNGLHEAQSGAHVPRNLLNPTGAAREAVFQYMISNLDWAMNGGPEGTTCCHNTKLMALNGSTDNLIPVPYDYDYSGLVNAPYATPPDGIDVSNVRIRRYRGFCFTNAEALTAAEDVYAKKAALLAVYDNISGLAAATKSSALAYLEPFFEQIATPEGVNARLLKTCTT